MLFYSILRWSLFSIFLYYIMTILYLYNVTVRGLGSSGSARGCRAFDGPRATVNTDTFGSGGTWDDLGQPKRHPRPLRTAQAPQRS